ncbi:MAG: hypothetical protein P1V97_03825 [Planctomycetota bacterium]|nr:hypothetical protein [Planctomycetota bacterium]
MTKLSSHFYTLLCLALLVSSTACQSSSAKTHRTGGVAPYVAVKGYWTDDSGEKHLVGGLNCVLISSKTDKTLGKKTVADKALKFETVTPGPSLVKLTTPDGQFLQEEFTLPERRRVTVRFDLDAKKGADALKGVAKDTAYVLVEGSKYLLVVVAIVALASVDNDDDDHDHGHGHGHGHKHHHDEYQDDPVVNSDQVIKESKRIERRFRRLKKKL